MPELPQVTRDRLLDKYGLSPYDADVLIDNDSSSYFEQVKIQLDK
jgi:Asp-tRNA(Asn)/Glu-tRNA(Gln) amidotransferase B subunit